MIRCHELYYIPGKNIFVIHCYELCAHARQKCKITMVKSRKYEEEKVETTMMKIEITKPRW
jgi:hypothetical protein